MAVNDVLLTWLMRRSCGGDSVKHSPKDRERESVSLLDEANLKGGSWLSTAF